MHPIFQALENDSFEEFKKLITSNPEYLNEIDEDGWSILSLSVHYNMPNFVTFLLDNMTSEQINNGQPLHPLNIAIENKFFDLGKLIISHDNFDPNSLFKAKENALHYALTLQQDEWAEILLERGADIFAQNANNRSPFQMAIEKHKDDLLDEFLESPLLRSMFEEDWLTVCVDSNNVYAFEELYPHMKSTMDKYFERAVNKGHVEMMVSIINTGMFMPGKQHITDIVDLMCIMYDDPKKQEAALELTNYLFDINTPFQDFINKQGQTAWMLSIQYNNNVIFDRLINETVETVNNIDNHKYSPLMYAVEAGSLPYVTKLLKRKANPNHTDIKNDTALIKAVRLGNLEIVKEILSYPVLVNEINKYKESALSIALHDKRMDIIFNLLWHGADISTNPVTFINKQELMQIGLTGELEQWTAVDEQEIKNFKAIVQLGLNLNRVNENGDTLLLHYIKEGYLANFHALLECKIDANHKDGQNNSALMCAMNKNSDSYVIQLLSKIKNLDFSVVNNDGKNVYDLCIDSNSLQKAEALLQYDPNINKENLLKIIPILVKDGRISNHWEKIQVILGDDISLLNNALDNQGNTLLMNCIIGKNRDNFKFLTAQTTLNITSSQINKDNDNIVDLINKLPEDNAMDFTNLLSKYINTTKKKPIEQVNSKVSSRMTI